MGILLILIRLIFLDLNRKDKCSLAQEILPWGVLFQNTWSLSLKAYLEEADRKKMKIVKGELVQSSNIYGCLEIWISLFLLLIEMLLFLTSSVQTLLLLEHLPDFLHEISLFIPVLQDLWLPLWNLAALDMTLLGGPYDIYVALYLRQLYNVLSTYLDSKKLLGGDTLSFTMSPLPQFLPHSLLPNCIWFPCLLLAVIQ